MLDRVQTMLYLTKLQSSLILLGIKAKCILLRKEVNFGLLYLKDNMNHNSMKFIIVFAFVNMWYRCIY